MTQLEQINKYKNLAINIAIILLALVIAFNIYQGSLSTSASLKAQISAEEKKNIELEKIVKMEKRIDSYKDLLPGKDTSAVMDAIIGFAKASGVKVLSVKPLQEESRVDYLKRSFNVVMRARTYNNLARFVNMLEGSDNVYIVENIDMDRAGSQDNSELTANLRISSVSATVK